MNASQSWETRVNWLLNHSFQAGLLVLLVLGVQWIFRRQLTSRWRFGLWWIVLARLLLPVTPESGLSLFNFFQPKLQLNGPRYTTPQEPEATREPSFPVSVREQPAPGRWPESSPEGVSKNLIHPHLSPEPLLLNPLPSVNRRLTLDQLQLFLTRGAARIF